MAHRNTGGHDPVAESASGRTAPEQAHSHRGYKPAICVFCGSSPGNDRIYAKTARELGRHIGEGGYRLIFGGGAVGLMGEVARAARSAGAPIIGILPAFLRGVEPPLKSAEELVITPDLQQRKSRMLTLADAFVILPGGLGTLDEFFEVLNLLKTKNTPQVPVILIGGEFWKSCDTWMSSEVVQHHGITKEDLNFYYITDDLENAICVISEKCNMPLHKKK